MKKIKLILFTILSFSFLFIGCDKSTEPDEKPEEAFEKSAQSMNMTMMNTINSQLYLGLSQMPQGLIDIPDAIMPLQDRNIMRKSITKNNLISADSTILEFFENLKTIYGTHTYDGTTWVHTNSPANEVVIIYPFVNLSNNTTHMMNIRIFGVLASETLNQLSMEAKVDNIRKFYLEYLKVTGTALLSASSSPQNVEIKGEVIDDNNNKNTFLVNISDNTVSIALTAGKMETLTLTILGNDFLSANDSLNSDGQNLTSITITQGKIKIELIEFNISNGDAGNIYYNNIKIADIMIVNDEAYIYYLNGKQVAMSELLPVLNSFSNGQ